jgi:hypothetical protein
MGGKPPYVAPDPLTRNQHESLHGAWWIAEFWPKIIHEQEDDGTWKRRPRMNLARRRYIAPGVVVHESVEQRLKGNVGYSPKNLPDQRTVTYDRCPPQSATVR